MPLVEDLAGWLASQSTSYAIGANLTVHGLPDGGDRPQLAIIAEDPGEAVLTYGRGVPAMVTPIVTLVARSTAPAAGRVAQPQGAVALLREAWDRMCSLRNSTVSTGGRVVSAVPLGDGCVSAGLDEQLRSHFEARLQMWYTPSTGDY